ncbi:MAG: SHD1 domain-containing protein [Opitutaceae bacterium]
MFRILTLWLLILLSWQEVGARAWTSHSGVEIEADLVWFKDGTIRLRKADGQIIQTSVSNLAQTDLEYLKSKDHLDDAFGSDTANALNSLLGFQLFAGRALWQESEHDVADRLSWRAVSKTDYMASYQMRRGRDRSRRSHNVELAADDKSARTAFLYAQSGAPDYFLVMYNNIEDVREEPESRQHELELKDQLDAGISDTSKHLQETLSGLLGEPKLQAFYNGRASGHRMLRWDFGDVSFLLSEDKEFGLFLYIHRTEFADRSGQIAYSHEALESKFLENVETRSNQDVVVRNIPMVNQGDHGFCVPATFERYLRYFGIPADMHTLAMLGETKMTGGTRVNKLRNEVARYLDQQGFQMRRLSSTLTTERIADYIDRGVPLIWTLSSSKAFNQIANDYTRDRRQGNTAFTLPDKESLIYPHVAMITGYNATEEAIAISDSWGPSYEERWIPIALARQYDVNGLFVIEF